MENKDIRYIINNRITSLPTLPTVVANILTLVQKNSSSARDVAAYISQDQAISSAVLKIANSAYYNLSGKVEAIDRAVVVLGFETVKNLALGTSVFSNLKSDEESVFDREGFWIHAIGVGTAANMISKEILKSNDPSFFVSGLFHDLGKIIFDRYLNDMYIPVVSQAKEEGKPLYNLENEVFGLNHADVGSMLLTRWKIPSLIINRLKYHHNLESCPAEYAIETAVIVTANYLCHLKNMGLSLVPEISLSETAFKSLQIKPDRLVQLGEKLEEMREKINSFVQSMK
ncbi:MAG: HDOD domain-containing protein [Thermodesulfobacteriota bacterium]|nr:HDOD domain-containing protein [Thermodesulfobacteriota bacterium]